MQLLMLTLLLPHDVAGVTITILLAMSFSAKFADNFVRQMTAPSTFQIYQHAMLGCLKQGKSLTEDFIVILQKITSRDPGAVSSQIDPNLTETLHDTVLRL